MPDRVLGKVAKAFAQQPVDQLDQFIVSRKDLFDTARLEPKIPKESPPIRDGTEYVRKILRRPIPAKKCPMCGWFKDEDSYVRVQNGLVYKQHRTKTGVPCPKSGQPIHGAIELVSIPVFGKQGMGKSKLVNFLAQFIVEKHGTENVQFLISNDFRALQDNIDPRKPVIVLFLDDALDSAFSRGGTPAALRDAIKDYFKTRHKLEKQMRLLNGEEVDESSETMDDMHYAGLIYFFIGSQSFKALEKQFRSGIMIFKSPLEEDNAEITATWNGTTGDAENRSRQIAAAWDELFEVQRLKIEEHDFSALSRSVVVVPSRGPMLMKSEMPKQEYFEPPFGRRVKFEEAKKETELEQESRVVNHIADLFNQQYDPGSASASSYLRTFIRDYFLKIARNEVEDHLLRIQDHEVLTKPNMLRKILDQAKTTRLQRAAGEAATSTAESDQALIEEVAKAWIRVGRGDPMQKQNGIANSKLFMFITNHYRQQPEKAARAEALRNKIMMYATAYVAQQMEQGGPAAAAAQPEAPVITGPQFEFDANSHAALLPERMAAVAAKKGKAPAEAKKAWDLKVKVWRRVKMGDGISFDRLARDEADEFGRVTGRTLGMWAAEVETAIGQIMGNAYEAWWERQIATGYWHEGLRKVPIRKVTRGGGQGHLPDITIEYEDGWVDYWSLKAYSVKQHVTLAVRNLGNQKPSDVAPELKAFMTAWERRETMLATATPNDGLPPRPRLCICYREVLHPGAEYFRIFDTPGNLSPTVSFNRNEIGTESAIQWQLPGGTSTTAPELRAQHAAVAQGEDEEEHAEP